MMDTLIQELVSSGYLKTPAVIEAFKKINRKDFVPTELREMAYVNEPLPIGYSQTISQPLTVAFMLELLELAPGQKVLDIGTGSGWQAALIAQIVGPRGLVVSVERIKELSVVAKENLSKYKFKNIMLVLGDGSRGWPALSPYERIVGAAASEAIPQAWRGQLKVGGVIVTPVGASLVKLHKTGPSEFKKREYPGFYFVPLIENGD